MNDEKLFIDGSHIKASANPHKYRDEVIEKTVRIYEKDLLEEIEQDRARHGKKPLKEQYTGPEQIHRKVSTTDRNVGIFIKESTKKFLPILPIPVVTGMDLCWILKSVPAICTIVYRSGRYMNEFVKRKMPDIW